MSDRRVTIASTDSLPGTSPMGGRARAGRSEPGRGVLPTGSVIGTTLPGLVTGLFRRPTLRQREWDVLGRRPAEAFPVPRHRSVTEATRVRPPNAGPPPAETRRHCVGEG